MSLFSQLQDFRDKGGFSGWIERVRERNEEGGYNPFWTDVINWGEQGGLLGTQEGMGRIKPPDVTPVPSTSGGRVSRESKSLRGREEQPYFTGTIHDQANKLVSDYKKNLAKAISSSIGILGRTGQNITNQINTRIGEISGSLPRYSAERLESNVRMGKSDILNELQDLIGEAGDIAGERGMLGGGQLSSATAQLHGEAISAGSKLRPAYEELRDKFNYMAESTEHQLINDIMKVDANIKQNIGLAQAQIKRGEIPNPEFIWNIASELENLDVAKFRFDETMALMEEHIEALGPDALETLTQIIGAGLTASGAPLEGMAATAVAPLYDIFKEFDFTNILGGGRR